MGIKQRSSSASDAGEFQKTPVSDGEESATTSMDKSGASDAEAQETPESSQAALDSGEEGGNSKRQAELRNKKNEYTRKKRQEFNDSRNTEKLKVMAVYNHMVKSRSNVDINIVMNNELDMIDAHFRSDGLKATAEGITSSEISCLICASKRSIRDSNYSYFCTRCDAYIQQNKGSFSYLNLDSGENH